MLDLIEGVGKLVTQGGKRLRPASSTIPIAPAGHQDEEALLVALATELLHTYLLIHDDIMDHAEMRRGQPSAHVRFRQAHLARGFHGDAEDFGRSVAILLGDLAHTWAVELFTGAELRAAHPLLLGDERRGDRRPVLRACWWHSAARPGRRTCCACCGSSPAATRRSGRSSSAASLAPAPERSRGALALRRAVGEAFQLQDDLLGMFGDAGTVGSRSAKTCGRGSSPS